MNTRIEIELQVFIGNKETISENMVVALVMAVQEENEQIEAREK